MRSDQRGTPSGSKPAPPAWCCRVGVSRNPRPFHPAALPARESAFAMIVPNAQGSELDKVCQVLPERDDRVLLRGNFCTPGQSGHGASCMPRVLRMDSRALSRHGSCWSGGGGG